MYLGSPQHCAAAGHDIWRYIDGLTIWTSYRCVSPISAWCRDHAMTGFGLASSCQGLTASLCCLSSCLALIFHSR